MAKGLSLLNRSSLGISYLFLDGVNMSPKGSEKEVLSETRGDFR